MMAPKKVERPVDFYQVNERVRVFDWRLAEAMAKPLEPVVDVKMALALQRGHVEMMKELGDFSWLNGLWSSRV